jgi:hypothetical protein
MRRNAVGIIALVLLAGAAYFWFFPPESAAMLNLEAAFRRVGLLMGAWWLAYEEVQRLPNWAWTAIPVLIVVLALRPRLFLVAIPVIIILAILRPRFGKKA